MKFTNPDDETWQRYRESGDASEIAEAFMPLVEFIARGIERRQRYLGGLFREDLVSAGAIGLMKAIRGYKRGSFKKYAELRIYGAMIDEMREWSFGPRRAQGYDGPSLSYTDQMGHHPSQMEFSFDAVDDREEVEWLMSHLERRDLDSIRMTYFEHMTLREAARKFGVNERRIWEFKHRALETMRHVAGA